MIKFWTEKERTPSILDSAFKQRTSCEKTENSNRYEFVSPIIKAF